MRPGSTSRLLRPRPEKPFLNTCAAALFAVLAGCQSAGLSPRENVRGGGAGGPNYANYVYSLYAADDPTGVPSPKPALALPARIAVAQVGEVSAPQAMIDALRKEPRLVAVAQGIPDAFDGTQQTGPRQAQAPDGLAPAQRQARWHVEQMRRYAADMGLDYLFLFGGTVDFGTQKTGMSVLDLTIVGAYVVPSRVVHATGRASGTLIDVKTGRVVLAVASEAHGDRLASMATRESREGQALQALRDDLIAKLATNLLDRMDRR